MNPNLSDFACYTDKAIDGNMISLFTQAVWWDLPSTLIDLHMGFSTDYQHWWHTLPEILNITFKRPNRCNLLERNVNQNKIGEWKPED